MPFGMAQVMVDLRTKSLTKSFDYEIPAPWRDRVVPGQRVYVSFGRQHCQGFVKSVEWTDNALSRKLKPILAVLDETPLLTEEMLQLIEWLQWRYVCTPIEAVQTVLPSAFRLKQVRRYRSNPVPHGAGIPEADELWRALTGKALSFEQIVARYGDTAAIDLERLLHSGAVSEVLEHKDRIQAKMDVVISTPLDKEALARAITERQRRAPKQANILARLDHRQPLRLTELGLRPSNESIKKLRQAGLIEVTERESNRAPTQVSLHAEQANRVLTSWQDRALAAILRGSRDQSKRHFLIHGVTGSGKTEVYLRLIEDTLRDGGGAIVLVPEIALTPQMVSRFVERFGDHVAVLHSRLSAGEKRDEWMRIHRGQARIAIGARSAVFAPVQNLRLLIVDEEHENSYKQEESPRYDAREVALWRADFWHGVTVFGSATPSLSAMKRVEDGRAVLIEMPTRVHGRGLPPVDVVDMRDELRQGNRGVLSRALQAGIDQALAQDGQSILFLNRRGYAAFVMCRNCGETAECPHCDISLTLHRRPNQSSYLKCHYCGHTEQALETCRACGEPALRAFGVGTQQVEEALHARWPGLKTLRMDVDTTRHKGAHQDVIRAFINREADVLIGTQMVAKGLDFPDVMFVGVISADTMLSVPDYRSAERTFSLLTQVAGRSGRSEKAGRTVVQTYRPEHFAVQAAAHHDFAAFYRQERDLRAMFVYPPFCELTVFMASHHSDHIAKGAAQRFERELRRRLVGTDASILSAVPAMVGRIEDRFRYQVVVKYSLWQDVHQHVAGAYHLVLEKMLPLRGMCSLDVNAGRV